MTVVVKKYRDLPHSFSKDTVENIQNNEISRLVMVHR